MKIVKDDYINFYGNLIVEKDNAKFEIDYSLDFDEYPSDDDIVENIEKCLSLEEVIKSLDIINTMQLSFKSIAIGSIFDIDDEEDEYTLELSIDTISNIDTNDDEDVEEWLDDIIELVESYR